MGALRATADFRSGGWQTPAYAALLVVALALIMALHVGMERRAVRTDGAGR